MTAVAQSGRDIRNQLEQRRAELIARKRSAAADLSHREQPVVADFGDAAIQTENDEALAAIVKAADQEINAIERAIERWDIGLFGVCESCGAQIPAARLAAVPYAVSCADCTQTR